MTDQLDRLEEEEEAGSTEEVDSLLSTLRGLREKAKAEHHLDLVIPGYEDGLWVRFRAHPVSKTEKKASKMADLQQRGQAVLLDMSCQGLIDACDQIMALPKKFKGDIGPDGVNLVPLDDETPIKFDKRLAELFNFSAATSKEVVIGMFGTEQAILAMNVAVSQWMTGATRQANEDLLGE